MKVQITKIADTLTQIITSRSGLSEDEARLLASDYLEGELQGKKTHGLASFPAVVGELQAAHGNYQTLRETDSLIYADAQGSLGAIVGAKLADAAVEKASKQGVGVVLIREMKSWLRPATIAQYVAEKGMLAWVVNTGGPPAIAPPGGREPVVGTNPIGFAIPAGTSQLVTDMATSNRAWGEVRLAKRFNHDLPEDSFLDSQGIPTFDPDEAYSAVPFGGYKGFSLSLLIEVLGGSLVGMNMGKGNPSVGYYSHHRGAFILVINPAFTVGSTEFSSDNEAFFQSIKNTQPAKGSDGVTLPGDRASEARASHFKDGYLEVDDDLWAEICKILDD